MRDKIQKILFFALALCLFVATGAPARAQDVRQTITVTVGDCSFEMVYVAGGSYIQGHDEAPFFFRSMPSQSVLEQLAHYADEAPRHRVDLYGFYMGRYEVTQRLWTTVMGYNPSNFVGDDLPVEQVDYYEVKEFIRRLNELTNMKFRLPTEAEWEYAARGGRRSKGYTYPGGDEVIRIGWNHLNSDFCTHPVGSLIPNELGLYDMSGNVWEWCNDWYDTLAYLWVYTQDKNRPDYINTNKKLRKWYSLNHALMTDVYGRPYESDNEFLDPRGPDTGVFRVGRGGSWTDEPRFLRSSYRNFWVPERKLSILGFRLALSAAADTSLMWMPNQYLIDSIVDGKVYKSITTATLDHLQQGILEGIFSVGPNKRIHFSRGNLQYNAAVNQWRFADRQHDRIGMDNLDYAKDYAGWIDLFAWGTSGYHDRKPYYFSPNPKYYGNGKKNIDGTSYDWGVYNRISNGGDRVGLWRTLTVNEWIYLLIRRPDAMLLRSQGVVEGVGGIILLPDDWLRRGFDTLDASRVYQFSPQQWKSFERGGAVFLPTAGVCHMARYTIGLEKTARQGMPIEGVEVSFGSLRPKTHAPVSKMNTGESDPPSIAEIEFQEKTQYREPEEDDHQLGYYWTSIHNDERTAFGLLFVLDMNAVIAPVERLTRCSVRLVQDLEQPQKKGRK